MKLGRVEVLLIVLLIVGSAWMASQYLPFGSGPRTCAPMPLSPEVKAYIDSKIASGAGSQCGDIPKMVSRVSELEGRMGDLDKFRQMREQIEEKRQQLEQAISQQRRDQADLLANVRNAEVARLRNDVATMCAGITVKSADDKDKEALPTLPRNGAGGGAGGGYNRNGGGFRRQRQGGGSGGAVGNGASGGAGAGAAGAGADAGGGDGQAR